MDTQEIAHFLKDVELFHDLDEEERRLVAEMTETKVLGPKAMLFRENTPRRKIFIIQEGEVQLFKKTATGEEKRLVVFGKKDFLGENVLIDDTAYSTSARTLSAATVLSLDGPKLKEAPDQYLGILVKMIRRTAKVMVRRMIAASSHVENVASQYLTGKTRTEHDLLGHKQIPHEYYYGIQTRRAIENFDISGGQAELLSSAHRCACHGQDGRRQSESRSRASGRRYRGRHRASLPRDPERQVSQLFLCGHVSRRGRDFDQHERQ